MAGTSNIFDGHDLQTDSIITNDIDHYSGPTKDQPMYGVGHGNHSSIPFMGWPSKTIVETGTLEAGSIIDMDNLIDTFKSYFTGKDKFLDVGYAGGLRRYICTPQSPQIKRPGGLTHATWSVTYDCTLPFGRNIAATAAVNATGRTAGMYTDNHVFIGSAPWQYILATFTFHSIGGGTNASITLGNNANGQQVTITRNWTNGDVVQISSDPFNRFVTVNGVLFDWSGALPEFEKGSQYIAYSDTFTSRNFDENIIYYPMWM